MENALIDCSQYWQAIRLLIKKSHVINRRLAGVVEIGCFHLAAALSKVKVQQISTDLQSLRTDDLSADTLLNFLIDLGASVTKSNGSSLTDAICHGETDVTTRLVIVNKLLAKNLKLFSSCYELVILDFADATTTFIAFAMAPNHCSAAETPYCIRYERGSVTVDTECVAGKASPNSQWVKRCLLPRFIKWCHSFREDQTSTELGRVESIGLIDLEEYNELYNKLKEKYGLDMVKRWPEKTDPAKFVYEDVAIATYLLLLWQQERRTTGSSRMQSFADLGCGNGLLVYILSSEGHPGVGIDLRKRGIWDTFPDTTVLKVESITPSNAALFPDTDWIIGNHSDELSPWIPVIAARSSYTARYFVLPCCAYEFNGNKYQRQAANTSQYNDFMAYVQRISNVCGFNTFVDRLKIPSTKRVCLVGYGRQWPVEQMDAQCEAIQQFIDQRTKSKCANATGAWSDSFRPRSNVELVKNCSTIDRGVQAGIVRCVFEHLLTKRRYVHEVSTVWNIGGQVALADLAKLVPQEQLSKLKSECGGLQTLLRNNHQIFLVQKGVVQLRPPVRYAERLLETPKAKDLRRPLVLKQKMCWFKDNHPDGCPFSDADCSFSHISVASAAE